MKSLKKLAIVGAIVLALTVTTVTAFAAPYSSPAEIIAGLTGESADGVRTERVESGSTYGSIADSYGVLEAFEEQMLEQKEKAAEMTMFAKTQCSRLSTMARETRGGMFVMAPWA